MVTMWHFCGCVSDCSDPCSVKLIHASLLKCSNWRKLGIGIYVLIGCWTRVISSNPCISVSFPPGLTTTLPAVILLQLSLSNSVVDSFRFLTGFSVPTLGVLWLPTRTCTRFPDISPFCVTHEIIVSSSHAAIFPNCCLQQTQSFQSDAIHAVLFGQRWDGVFGYVKAATQTGPLSSLQQSSPLKLLIGCIFQFCTNTS